MAVYIPPTPIIKPYCDSGAMVVPPIGTSTTVANQEIGWPPLQATPLNAGGIPSKIEQFNGVLNLYSAQILATIAGVQYTFDPDFSMKYTGYPAGITLYAASNNSYQTSLVANNTANFITTPSFLDDGIHWSSNRFINILTCAQTQAAGNITSSAGNLIATTGILDAKGVKGSVTGSNPSAGLVGETFNAYYGPATVGVGITILGTINLQAGNYTSGFNAVVSSSGTGTVDFWISTTIGAGPQVLGDNASETLFNSPSGINTQSTSICLYPINISTPTTYYLNMNNSTSGTVDINGSRFTIFRNS